MSLGGTAWAQPAGGAAPVTYVDHVRPLFAARCLNCHNADKMKGDLDLSSFAGVMAGSSGGAIVEAGNAEGSVLLAVASHQREPFMPPKGDRLADGELDVIRRWIAGGARETAESKAVAARPAVSLGAGVAVTGAVMSGPMRMPLVTVAPTARSGGVLALAAHPASPVVAFGDQGQVLVYDVQKRTLAGALDFRETIAGEAQGVVRFVRFTRDGRFLLAAGGVEGMAGYVRVWGVPDGERVLTLGDELDVVLAADLHPGRERIAIGGPSRVVKVLAVADGKVLSRITKHTDWVTAVAYSPDGVLLATADRAGGLLIWEAQSMAPYQAPAGHQAAITSLDWSGDSNILASAGEDGRVRLWEMNEGRMVKEWNAHAGGVLSVRVTSDGRIVTAGRDGVAKLWDAGGGLVRAFPAMGSIAMAATLDASLTRVVAADLAGNVAVWKAEDGAALGVLASNPPLLAERLAAAERVAEAARARAKEGGDGSARAEAVVASAQAEFDGASAAMPAAEDAEAKARAAFAAAQAGASAARVEAERAAGVRAGAALAVAAAGAEVERALGALKASVEEDLTLQGQLTLRQSEYAAREGEAAEAARVAAASDDPAKRAAADAASAAAGTARDALGVVQKAAGESSVRVRAMVDASEKVKAAHAKAAAEADGANLIAKNAADAGAAASAAEKAAAGAAESARAGLESARARVAKAGGELERARAAAREAGRVRDVLGGELASAEGELARCRAGVVRQELDAVSAELARIEGEAAPAVAKAEASAAEAAAAAASLAAAEQELSTAPARIAQLEAGVKTAEASVVAARGAAEAASNLVKERAATHGALAVVVTQLRADAARSPQDVGLAAAVAKAGESLAEMAKSVAAARGETERTASALAASVESEAASRAALEVARVGSEALPAKIAALKAEAEVKAAAAVRDRAGADAALAPGVPLRGRIAEMRVKYEELLGVAER
jgi:hypothetical protein